MRQLLRTIRNLYQLQCGPQDFPHSPTLLGLLVCVSVLLETASAAMLGFEHNVLFPVIASVMLTLALTWSALTTRGYAPRFVQTASALIACAIAFNLLVLPIALSIGTPPATPEQLTSLQIILALAELALISWKLIVDAHILRHALDMPFGLGLLFAIVWAFLSQALEYALLGAKISQ